MYFQNSRNPGAQGSPEFLKKSINSMNFAVIGLVGSLVNFVICS